jgi:cell division protein FtsN
VTSTVSASHAVKAKKSVVPIAAGTAAAVIVIIAVATAIAVYYCKKKASQRGNAFEDGNGGLEEDDMPMSQENPLTENDKGRREDIWEQ